MSEKRIPIHGSMTRPGGPDDGKIELKEGRVKWSGVSDDWTTRF